MPNYKDRMKYLTENDLIGRFFFKTDSLSDYYNKIRVIEGLLIKRKWLGSITGYYINHIGNDLRLTIFTSRSEQAVKVITDFKKEQNLIFSKDPEMPISIKISKDYGAEEFRFRRFLSTYSPIGLDILNTDLFHAKSLFAVFRFQVVLSRKSYKTHFLKTFQAQSPFYNSLPEVLKNQFWSDLEHWPNPPQVDWAHMFVNMILGLDWNPELFLIPKKPLSIQEINDVLKENDLGFQIPNDWELLT